MSIDDFYVTSFTAKRMVWATDGSGNQYSALADSAPFSGQVQQSSMELAQSVGLTFTKAYTIWCPFSTDVNEGDQLVSGLYIYTVRSRQEFGNGDNKHLELACGREPYVH